MTKFTDGPASETALMLRRAPMFLRIVRAPDGKIDALDQLEDKPAVDEEVFVYRRTELTGHVHIRAKKGGGFYALATYTMVEPQPDRSHVRSSKAWQAWAMAQAST